MMRNEQSLNRIWSRKLPWLFVVVSVVIGFLAACTPPRPAHPTALHPVVTLEQFQRQLDRILADSLLLPTNVGIKIVSLKTGRTLYARNADKLFHPASNMKLLTTATALHELGVDYRLKTVVATDSTAELVDSVLHGNLYIKGYGNPQLTLEDLGWLATMVRQQGIRRITGAIVCDASYFDSTRWPAGWMWDDQNSSDFVSVGALVVHNNIVEITLTPGTKPGDTLTYQMFPRTSVLEVVDRGVTVGDSVTEAAVAERDWQWPRNRVVIRGQMRVGQSPEVFEVDVLHPQVFVGDLFRQALARQGVTVTGPVTEGQLPANARQLAVHRSEPLSVIVLHTNKPSHNLSAEMLCKVLGAERFGVPGTWENGLRVIRQYLSTLGIDSTEYEIVDGSGVSRYNLLTPSQMVQLLTGVHADYAIQPEFEASLPIAGVDGTLSNRMKGTPAENNLRAKTGTLSGVSALSGYTETADGELLAFSIMMQHFVLPARQMRAIQDKVGAWISSVAIQYPQKQKTTSR